MFRFLIPILALLALGFYLYQPKELPPENSKLEPLGANERHLYLAHWEWNAEEEYWQAPGKPLGLIDLRSLPQQKATSTPFGYGLFVYDAPQSIADSLYLGDSLDDVISNADKTELRKMFELPENPTSNTPRDFLWDMLGKYSDPKGDTGPRPLMPDTNLDLLLKLKGFSVIRAEKFDINTHPNRDKIVAALQENYRKKRASYLTDSRQSHYKQYLDVLEEKYKASYKTFIPKDLPDEGKAPHETTISDDFNRADDILSNGPWAQISPTIGWSVTSNEVTTASQSVVSLARHTSALSSDDMEASIDSTVQFVANSAGGPWARVSVGAIATVDGYFANVDEDNSNMGFFKVVDGTRSALTAFTTVTVTIPDTVKIEVNGSSMKSYLNGVLVDDFTDTTVSGETSSGIHFRRGAEKGDNFTASDLAPPPAPPPAGTPPVDDVFFF